MGVKDALSGVKDVLFGAAKKIKTKAYIKFAPLKKPIAMDKITMARIALLDARLRDEAKAIVAKCDDVLSGRAKVRFTQTLRTIGEQNAFYAQGRTAQGKVVTWAKGGESYHNYGLAVDIALIVNSKEASWDTLKDDDGDGVADWMECVRIFESYGWEWGGRWSRPKTDMPHFQKTFGLTISDLKKINKIG